MFRKKRCQQNIVNELTVAFSLHVVILKGTKLDIREPGQSNKNNAKSQDIKLKKLFYN